MASNQNVDQITTPLKDYHRYYKDGWVNGKDGKTPIVAEALNQIEKQLGEVYDAVAKIDTPDAQSTTPLQDAVKTYKDSVDTKFTKLLDPNDQTGETAKKATSVNITTQEAEDAIVRFQVGSGTAYEKTINNVAHATSAQQLDDKPELTAYNEDNTITITAGQKTSDKFTVPFATETNKLQNPIKITLTGDVTEEEVEFDGSSDITLPVNVTDDSHNHIIDNVDGLQDELNSLDSRLDTVESFFKTDESASIVDDITTLKEIVDELRKDNETEFAIQEDIKELQEKPVVTYTTTDGDYAAEDEIVFICGDAQPYIPN